jgi:DNA ligase-1
LLLVELYGKDKGGTYKVWAIGTTESGDLTIAYGQEGGKQTVKMEKIKPKNVGRANETTPEQQADLEAQGRIKKQIDKGYRYTKGELDNLPLLAMLAGDYLKIPKRIKWKNGVDLSDKLDGVRCVAKCTAPGVVTMESRTGQPWVLPHVLAELEETMRVGEVFDGELYKHGYALQDITSAVKRTDTQKAIDAAQRKYDKAVGDEKISEAYEELQEAILIHELRPQLQFIVFDIPSEEKWTDRLRNLKQIHFERLTYKSFVFALEYTRVFSEEEMKVAHKDCVARGFEGIMMRNADGVYESGKRSADLQKYKEFIDSEFVILDVLPAKDDGSAFLVQNDLNDETFSVTLGSMVQRAEYLANKHLYIGKLITVQYQARYKDTLLPQFPTGKAIRDYE